MLTLVAIMFIPCESHARGVPWIFRLSIGWFTIYPLRPIALRPNRKSLFFQWAWTRRGAGIELDSIPASRCVQAH